MRTIILLVAAIFFGWTVLLGSGVSLGQTSSATRLERWQDALRLLDSHSSETHQQGEAWLRSTLANPQTSVEAAWSLALFCLKRNDYVALKKVVAAINQQYPKTTTSIEAAKGRFALVVAVNESEATSAEIAFKRVVRDILNANLPDDDKKINASLIGSMIGMLNHDHAKSPIPSDLLSAAERSLADHPQANLRNEFLAAKKAAEAQVESITTKLALLTENGPQFIHAEIENHTSRLATLDEEIEAISDMFREVTRNLQDQTKANRVSLKKLSDLVKAIEQDWNVPTPGHPGPAKPAPIKPEKSRIKVDSYRTETYWEDVKKSDGKTERVQRTKEVRKSASEIQRDREAIYARLLAIYKEEMTIFIAYQAALKGWQDADGARREKIKADRKACDEKKQALESQLLEMVDSRESTSKLLASKREEVQTLQMDCAVLTAMQTAYHAGELESLFRPRLIHAISIDEEKRRLLQISREDTTP